ncbi:glycosyltransferase family 2 protein [Glycocaulis profundi]|nr:glycosyltransferase family 2 protein [Glycocaulis profundi]
MNARPYSETCSRSWSAARPVLSVAIPFYREDPSPLIEALTGQLGSGAEIVLFGDGPASRAAAQGLLRRVPRMDAPVRLIVSGVNLGRSGARNRLAAAARGRWVLYLDADMTVGPDFITRWRRALDGAAFGAAFGGYDLPADIAPEHRVHAALARAGDVHGAAAREKIGATAVCSSNLAVRRDLMTAVPFDEEYRGWGWEDVDWAVRAARTAPLAHVDIPASHGGLQTVDELLAKFEQGGINYARFLGLHPEMAALPGAKAAGLIARTRSAGLVRALAVPASKSEALPVRARVLAVKLCKAALAAREMEARR